MCYHLICTSNVIRCIKHKEQCFKSDFKTPRSGLKKQGLLNQHQSVWKLDETVLFQGFYIASQTH